MSAKEMFEELGFELVYENSNRLIYRDKVNKVIIFTLCLKEYSAFIDRNNLDSEDAEYYSINMDLLKAINQQCKELGWFDGI